jgi:hypothetical protein
MNVKSKRSLVSRFRRAATPARQAPEQPSADSGALQLRNIRVVRFHARAHALHSCAALWRTQYFFCGSYKKGVKAQRTHVSARGEATRA